MGSAPPQPSRGEGVVTRRKKSVDNPEITICPVTVPSLGRVRVGLWDTSWQHREQNTMSRHLAPHTNWEIFIRQIDVTDKEVIDIGCGTGWFADAFFRSARSVTLLDGDAAILAVAKERWFRPPDANPDLRLPKLRLIEANFVEVTLPKDAFDVVSMIKTY